MSDVGISQADDNLSETPTSGMMKDSIEGNVARVLTWNINGLRKVAATHGGLGQLLDQFRADVGKSGVGYSTVYYRIGFFFAVLDTGRF